VEQSVDFKLQTVKGNLLVLEKNSALLNPKKELRNGGEAVWPRPPRKEKPLTELR
jgi:hypothetical protein